MTNPYKFLKYSFFKMLKNSHNSPHEIAMGMAIGLFIGLGPTFGFQLIPVLFICQFFKWNKVAGTLGVFITNPFTVIPIYLFYYWLGNLFIPMNSNTYEMIEKITQFQGTSFFEKLKYSYNILLDLGYSFLLGSFICATTFSILGYFIIKRMVNIFLEKKEKMKQKRIRKKK